jgi:hypothetical protein
MSRDPTRREVLTGAPAAALLAAAAGFPQRRERARSGAPAPPREAVVAVRIHNYGHRALAHPQVSFFQPLAPGEGAALPAQPDQVSAWLHDGDKGAALSVVLPGFVRAGGTILYRL